MEHERTQAIRDRVRCSVPFCGRTFKRQHPLEETICGKHWRLADKKARRFHTLAKKACLRAIEFYEASPTDRNKWQAVNKAFNRERRAWDRCKRQAIEAAGGIT